MSVLNYEAPYPVYAIDWCRTNGTSSTSHLPRSSYRLALGSFQDDYKNRISIIGLADERPLLNDADSATGSYSSPPPDAAQAQGQNDFTLLADALSAYPVTKIGWEPTRIYREAWKDHSTELLATTGDAVRIWEFSIDEYALSGGGGGSGYGSGYGGGSGSAGYVGRTGTGKPPGKLVSKNALTSKSKNPNPTSAPLTSFSWNTMAPNLIVTSSIDTTCTVWDISTSSAVTQLIAHDREVYDVAWVPGSIDAFVSVGADGSLRAFDLRSLEHSTILYETPSSALSKKAAAANGLGAGVASRSAGGTPSNSGAPPSSLLRLAFNPYDANYLATFSIDSPDVQILDMRSPGRPVVELKAHRGPVSAVGWGRQDSGVIATAGDDCQLLIWDLGSQGLYSSHASSAQSQTQSRSPHPDASSNPTSSSSPNNPSSSSSNNPNSSSNSTSQTRITSEPSLAYDAPYEINNIAWSPNLVGGAYTREDDGTAAIAPRGEWVAFASGRSVKALKV